MFEFSLQSGATVQTPLRVEKEIISKNMHILLMRKDGGGTPCDNVVCFNPAGQILWTIEGYSAVGGDNPYMNLSLNNDGLLIGETWSGVHLVIDDHTGKIIKVVKSRPW
jgi:hypothetical protein